MKEGIIGVLGGMGPEATVDLFYKIVANTTARDDQDHLRVIIDCNPKIPKRLQAIDGLGESPLPMMIETARNLEEAGATFIVVPCVTAHYYIDELRSHVDIPIMSIIDEIARDLAIRFPTVRRIGLLATTTTIRIGLFHQRLSVQAIEVLVPPPEDQGLLMSAIYDEKGIKAGILSAGNKEKILQAALSVVESGAQAVIAGCTEVPLVLTRSDLPVPLIDSLEVLARAAIRAAKDDDALR